MIQRCCTVPEKHNSEISSKTLIYWGFDQHGCVRTQLAALKHMCSDTLSASYKSSNTWCECLKDQFRNEVWKAGTRAKQLVCGARQWVSVISSATVSERGKRSTSEKRSARVPAPPGFQVTQSSLVPEAQPAGRKSEIRKSEIRKREIRRAFLHMLTQPWLSELTASSLRACGTRAVHLTRFRNPEWSAGRLLSLQHPLNGAECQRKERQIHSLIVCCSLGRP